MEGKGLEEMHLPYINPLGQRESGRKSTSAISSRVCLWARQSKGYGPK